MDGALDLGWAQHPALGDDPSLLHFGPEPPKGVDGAQGLEVVAVDCEAQATFGVVEVAWARASLGESQVLDQKICNLGFPTLACHT